jgi:hypothetical protein
MTSLRNLGIATVAGLALATGSLVLGGGAVAANAATPAASTTTSTTCTLAQLRTDWRASSALKTDLKALKAMPAGKDRRADAVKIRAKALDGGYGAGVEAKAKWRQDNKGTKLRPLPANLKSDLKTLHSDSKADKPAEAKKIAAGALSGTYGATIESFAKAVQGSCTSGS